MNLKIKNMHLSVYILYMGVALRIWIGVQCKWRLHCYLQASSGTSDQVGLLQNKTNKQRTVQTHPSTLNMGRWKMRLVSGDRRHMKLIQRTSSWERNYQNSCSGGSVYPSICIFVHMAGELRCKIQIILLF